jgi:phenol 2-monooxygenase
MQIGKPGVSVGQRARPAIVTRVSDSVPVPILSPFDGRFTIYFLIGDLEKSNSLHRLMAVDNFFREQSKRSLFHRFGAEMDDKPLHERLYRTLQPDRHTATIRGVPKGRELYTYSYDDIPHITADYIARPHSLFRISVVTTSPSTSSLLQQQIVPLLCPRTKFRAQGSDRPSQIFHPQRLFCDDIPVISPYRDSAPEAGQIFENPLHNKWGVDTAVGSIIVTRPDGYIGLRTNDFGLDAWHEVEKYFEEFLVPCQCQA